MAWNTLLGRAAEAGWDLRRVKVDVIYAGPTVGTAAERHTVDVQVSVRDPTARGFAPLPVRWRIEATFGTLTDCYRRLTRNLEQSGEAAENVIEMANLRRVPRVLTVRACEAVCGQPWRHSVVAVCDHNGIYRRRRTFTLASCLTDTLARRLTPIGIQYHAPVPVCFCRGMVRGRYLRI